MYLCCKKEEKLNSGLTEKQKETFEKFIVCTSELSCITEQEVFSSGFILATRIMVQVMQGLPWRRISKQSGIKEKDGQPKLSVQLNATALRKEILMITCTKPVFFYFIWFLSFTNKTARSNKTNDMVAIEETAKKKERKTASSNGKSQTAIKKIPNNEASWK